jgi:hypothetical protein
MGDHARISGIAGNLHGLQSFRDGPDLIELDEHGVCHMLRDRAADNSWVGHENVVADDLDAMSELTRLKLPAGPVASPFPERSAMGIAA